MISFDGLDWKDGVLQGGELVGYGGWEEKNWAKNDGIWKLMLKYAEQVLKGGLLTLECSILTLAGD